ncbi:MAG: hypothetical protein GMKNLPBB_01193 [Myxococcota bacterium]|nr:hypothetical protein [Myxococcota bacterium]
MPGGVQRDADLRRPVVSKDRPEAAAIRIS